MSSAKICTPSFGKAAVANLATAEWLHHSDYMFDPIADLTEPAIARALR